MRFSLLWHLWRAAYRKYNKNPIYGMLHPKMTKIPAIIPSPGFVCAFRTCQSLGQLLSKSQYTELAVTPLGQLKLAWLLSMGKAFINENDIIALLFMLMLSGSSFCIIIFAVTQPLLFLAGVILIFQFVMFDMTLGVLMGMLLFKASDDHGSNPLLAPLFHSSIIFVALLFGFVTATLTNIVIAAVIISVYTEIVIRVLWSQILFRYNAHPDEAENILSGNLP